MSKLQENDKKLKPLDKNVKKTVPPNAKKKDTVPKMRLSLP